MPGAETLQRCAELIGEADGLLVTAGAGMGVDSGLPDFRGPEGFWRHYPALAADRLRFEEIASPRSFERDPSQAWGFYGHRLKLYRATRPHAGFGCLQQIAQSLPHGAFVVTSNVDGQFQRAGFAADRLCEIHGSIHFLQCSHGGCRAGIWPADGFLPEVDEQACRLLNALPVCPGCGALARPNILMFGDAQWCDERTDAQYRALSEWLEGVRRPVVIEIGAGTAIPSIRRLGERFERLIRINPRESQVPRPAAIGLAMGGLEALQAIGATWAARRGI